MKTIRQIEARREAILEEMRRIRSLERGTINQYLVPVRKKGQSEPQPKGPYYVISRRAGKKTQGYHHQPSLHVSIWTGRGILGVSMRLKPFFMTQAPGLAPGGPRKRPGRREAPRGISDRGRRPLPQKNRDSHPFSGTKKGWLSRMALT